MIEIISALWPVFALILLGYAARKSGFLTDDFWGQAEKATYFVLFPILLVSRLASTDMTAVPLDQVGLAVVLLVFGGSLLVFLAKPFLSVDAAGITSIYQGGVRFNVYVGLAASATLFGPQGVVVGAVVMALMIPLLNFCCVLVFSYFTRSTQDFKSVLLALLKNPLIVGSLCGLLLNQSGVGFPDFLMPIADFLGRMALPLGLLSVGAGLSFKVLMKSGQALSVTSLIKLLLMPLLAFLICAVLGLPNAEIIWLYAALPTAASSYILARQLGGDVKMMAAIITGQTLFSMLTIPFMMIFLNFLQKSL
ncbi:AEC family transporter [Neptuniibacter sp. SY11_33]|uniref:AEC family transporter n=1 Tax=Neptuniibacter sp. SY11_33 TaxID=3398215 RepID=UPI0039F601B4